MRLHNQRVQTSLPLQDLAALRAVTSTSSFKPAEEQFIEQTPWANPQHPSHANLLQRQSSTHQPVRTSSPFSINPTGELRKHPNQDQDHTKEHSGAFPGISVTQNHTNGSHASGERISPLNPFANPSHTENIEISSPHGSRRASLSPQQHRRPPNSLDRQERHESSQDISTSSTLRPKETPNDFAYTTAVIAGREQATPLAERI